MRNHYRRLNGAKCKSFSKYFFCLIWFILFIAAVDSKPPKAMVLGQKCRDRARKELAQLVYTQNMLGQLTGGSLAATPRGRSSQGASVTRRNVQSQVNRIFVIFRTIWCRSSRRLSVHVREVLNPLVR